MSRRQWIVGTISVLGLAAVFIFQHINIAAAIGVKENLSRFFVNRTFRFFLNDLFTIGLIYALFKERKYVLFALYVQLAGVILFLIPYFILKLYLPQYNGPLISFLHRLVINPTLLMLLIPALYLQQRNLKD